MDLGLQGRLIVVTGASAGIGRATAVALAREGATLLLGARNPERLAEAVQEARDAGASGVHSVAADLTTLGGIATLTEAAQDIGDIHGIVTCVGSTPLGAFDELDDETWQRAFDMKFLSTVRAVRSLLPLMTRDGGGRVVMIGGNSALAPDPWMATSGAMNAALGNLAATLGRQFGNDGIGVVCVHPGPTRSARLDGLVDAVATRRDIPAAAAETWITDRVPRGTLAEPADVASAITYLCSPLAAHLSGTIVSIDGAQSWAR
jgi:3-oxoacyl-[acyl-carrier protein] reductase